MIIIAMTITINIRCLEILEGIPGVNDQSALLDHLLII
jgi:hypothetical protein